MTVREAIQARRSIRKYLPDMVPDEDLRTVLEAARLAPSGCNSQPWRFILVRDEATRLRIANEAMTLIGNQLMCQQAPVLIACLAVVDAHCTIPERVMELSQVDPSFAQPTIAKRTGRTLKSRFDNMSADARAAYMAQNTGVALTQMMLQATELGYGMCWMGAFDRTKSREILGVPDGVDIVAITPLGRPAETPGPRPRLPLGEIVFEDTYGGSCKL